MKDIHSHILYNIDDGSKSIEESIAILKDAEKEGVTDIVCTPHYMRGTAYNKNNHYKRHLFNKLNEEVKKNKIKINLYLGNEVYISTHLKTLIEQKEIYPINGTHYILLEFPLNNMIINTKEILFELEKMGYKVILAHPERYRIFKSHPEHIRDYLNMGIVLQGNYKSLFGKYGYMAKKTLIYFLKHGYITLLGSDTHNNEGYKLKKAYKKLRRLHLSDEYINKLMSDNFDIIINDGEFPLIK